MNGHSVITQLQCFLYLNWQMYKLRFETFVMYILKCECTFVCVFLLSQKNLSFPRFSFPISCQAVNGWFEFADRFWITPHQCHTCLWHWWRRRGIAIQQTEKQTGLQGDREHFWDWNQCAYYATGSLNRLGDEPRVWWSTVITGKLQTFLQNLVSPHKQFK